MTTAPQTRRWRRYSLRTLLGVITIFGIWFGFATDRAMKQKRAVEMVERFGGHVGYDHQRGLMIADSSVEPPGPRWLRRLIGEAYFTTPIEVGLYPTKGASKPCAEELAWLGDLSQLEALTVTMVPPTDDDVRQWTGLSHLDYLSVDGSKLTDTGLKHIGQLTQLTVLDLNDSADSIGRDLDLNGSADSTVRQPSISAITDQGLASLEGLLHLESLSLSSPHITDAGLRHLLRFPELMSLDLRDTPVTDAGLETVVQLGNLTHLNLARTHIMDQGLRKLAAIGNLQVLILDGTQITDEGLLALDRLPLTTLTLRATQVTGSGLRFFSGLQYLWLENTPVSDDTLNFLVQMPSLYILVLDGTRVTDAGLAHLAPLKRLYALGLSSTAITDKGLAQLVESNQAIWDLGIEHTQVTDAGLVPLRKLPLSILYAEGSGISESAAEQFRQATGAMVHTAAHPESAQ